MGNWQPWGFRTMSKASDHARYVPLDETKHRSFCLFLLSWRWESVFFFFFWSTQWEEGWYMHAMQEELYIFSKDGSTTRSARSTSIKSTSFGRLHLSMASSPCRWKKKTAEKYVHIQFLYVCLIPLAYLLFLFSVSYFLFQGFLFLFFKFFSLIKVRVQGWRKIYNYIVILYILFFYYTWLWFVLIEEVNCISSSSFLFPVWGLAI